MAFSTSSSAVIGSSEVDDSLVGGSLVDGSLFDGSEASVRPCAQSLGLVWTSDEADGASSEPPSGPVVEEPVVEGAGR
jgi:hypothetical protein